VRGEVLADALGLDMFALVALAAGREGQRREDDDGDHGNDDPDDGVALHGGSFRWNSRTVVDASANFGFPQTRLPKPRTQARWDTAGAP
jgi:hypothetical protein